MARIRTVKPDLFKNEALAELPVSARILFIGLFCLADKEGRLEDRPKRIKAEIFPYDNVDVHDQLTRLQSAGFIQRYEVGDLKVIQVVNFTKHQRITGSEALTESEFPPKGNTLETTWKHSGNTLDDRKGREGKGKEQEGNRKGKERKEGAVEENFFSEETAKEIFTNPFSNHFQDAWAAWKKYKKDQHNFIYKSVTTEQAAMNELVKLSKGDEVTARDIVMQSIAKGWKGFFELKSEKNGHAISEDKLKEKLSERIREWG